MSKLNSVEEYLERILANVQTEDWREVLTEVVHRTAELARKEQNEKACEWWNKEMREVNYGTYNEAIEAFRKAMEE